jgi:hypothetical protein
MCCQQGGCCQKDRRAGFGITQVWLQRSAGAKRCNNRSCLRFLTQFEGEATMYKRSLALTLMMVMVLLLSACGGAAPAPTTAPAEPAATEPAPAEPAAAEPAPAEPTATEPAAAEPAPAEPAAEPTAEPTVDPNLPTPEPTPVVNKMGTCDDPMMLWHGLTGSDGAVFAEMLQQYAEANPTPVSNRRASRGTSSSRRSHRRCGRHSTRPGHLPRRRGSADGRRGLMQSMDEWFTTTGIGKGPVQRSAHQPDHG